MSTIKDAMNMLSNKPNTIFIGQNIRFPKNQMYDSLIDIDDAKKIEMPVIEDTQMGISIGLAIMGFIPITIYPRFDFLILATNQIVNNLDKLYYLCSNHTTVPKVIIRTAIGNKKPINAGPQHTQNHTQAFKLMCKNINIVTLTDYNNAMRVYELAYNSNRSTIIIEIPNE